jgi:CBS domain-containing protein
MAGMTQQLEERSIGRIRSVGEDGRQEAAWVRCPRDGASIPLERCLSCPKLSSLKRDARGNESVACMVHDDAKDEQLGPISLPRLTVADLMTRNVLCVRPHLSLDVLTQLFVESQLKAVPVVDETGTVLGIVAEADVQLDVQTRSGDARGPRTAADVMMPAPFTLPEYVPVTRAAAMMVFEGVSSVVVVSAADTVVGVLSASDVLYWLAKADGFMVPPPRARVR